MFALYVKPDFSSERRARLFMGLIFTVLLSATFTHADPTVDITAQKQKIGQIEKYLRQEASAHSSLLPGDVRAVMGWMSSGWRPVMTDDAAADKPIDVQTAPDEENLSGNLSTALHHKGFLPTHDVLMLGVGAGHSLVDHKLQISARPFYGQNWRSLQGIWGGQVTVDIAQRPDGLPWGKIVAGYTGGNPTLTDGGRGIDVHGDVDLTEGWKLTSGLRQDSTTGDSNYIMMRWKIDLK